ncbi:hypothetical protein ABPG72_014963 [Tetrahymena utriculariae]
MEFSQDIKDSIKNNMIHITTVMKNKPRNYLNKQLQDAVCNYFLENYAAPFLKEEYQIVSGRELRKKIENSLPKQGKKYINLLNKFKSEIQRVQKGDEYRSMLSAMVSEEEKYVFESEEWCTLQRKKILSLLLIIHWDEENILNFYDMWNSLYPTDPLIKQKLSKEEKEKQKRLAKESALISNNAQTTQNYCQFSETSSQELNCKRSSSQSLSQSYDLYSFSTNTSQGQIYSDYAFFNQQNPRKIINNQIFEDCNEEQEEEQNYNIKFEYQQNNVVRKRVCEAVEISPKISKAQQYYRYYSNFIKNQQEPVYEQKQSQCQQEPTACDNSYNYEQNQQYLKVEYASNDFCESLSQNIEYYNLKNNDSQLCTEDSQSYKNDDFSYENAQWLNQCNYPAFLNNNSNLMENTLFSFINF